MFENKLIKDIHVSRYIASWHVAGGHLGTSEKGRFDFAKWLESLGLTDEEVAYIYNYATNGKLELENSVRVFLRDKYVN